MYWVHVLAWTGFELTMLVVIDTDFVISFVTDKLNKKQKTFSLEDLYYNKYYKHMTLYLKINKYTQGLEKSNRNL
jgi:hypothetical protein